MPASDASGRAPKHASELNDVYELLDAIRLRPGMWVRGGSLLHLDSMLVGYRIALNLRDVDDDWPFWSPGKPGPFSDWLWQRLGRHSSLSWAAEIEREAQAADQSAMDLFFSLFDEYRAERSQTAR
ncbi:hypothetical protein [Streptomyces abyssomicinicus]|uniref:hypothetical protein n=1 Tax=Streptomyces abyssomicinicus TaxID=574929 RepID=UPI001583C0E8|nr:hypothetical protein [Streptomyces abyssomicinicus]